MLRKSRRQGTTCCNFYLIWILCLFSAGCSDPRPHVPESYDPYPTDVSIAYLKSLYNGTPHLIDRDHTITGYVVSSDRYGNFYKTLVIEDSTGGIGIKLDRTELYGEYYLGDCVSVYCNGLCLGGDGGQVVLGGKAEGDYQTTYIPNERVGITVRKNASDHREVIPHPLTLAGLSARYLDCPVSFDGVQFIGQEIGLTWSEKDADTDRHLVDRNGDTLAVRTSRYAEFANRNLPPGSGYIEGVLGWFGGRYLLKVVDPWNLDMSGERF